MKRTTTVAGALRFRMVLAALVAVASACGDGDGDEARKADTKLTLETPTVMAGQTTRAVLRDETGAVVDVDGAAWSTSDPAVATIAPNGFVATFAPGTVTIAAEQGTRHAATELVVTAPPPHPTGGTLVELSPPVVVPSDSAGLAVIIDFAAPPDEVQFGPGAVISLLVYTPALELFPMRRVGASTRYVATVPADRLARLVAEPPPAAWHSDRLRYVGDVVVGHPSESDSVGVVRSVVVPIADERSPVGVTMLAPDAQRSDYVVNIRHDDWTDDSLDLRESLPTFYRHLPDAYSFLVVNAVAGPSAIARYTPIRNRVEGIGEPNASGLPIDAEGPLFDHATEYGASANGALLGVVELYENHFDLADQLLSHELGHAFANYLRGVQLADATESHFQLSTAAFGLMSGVAQHATDRMLTPLGDGTFRVDPRTPWGGYNELELYLMGLADPAEVPDQLVFADASQEPTIGAVLHGPTTRVTISDVIAANGVRRPAWSGTPVTFRLATIVVSRGRLLTAAEMSYYDAMARRGEATTSFDDGLQTPFTVNTRGRGVLRTRLDG